MNNYINILKWFILGIKEFRRTYSTTPPDKYFNNYDWGREIAHRLTLRYFDSI